MRYTTLLWFVGKEVQGNGVKCGERGDPRAWFPEIEGGEENIGLQEIERGKEEIPGDGGGPQNSERRGLGLKTRNGDESLHFSSFICQGGWRVVDES